MYNHKNSILKRIYTPKELDIIYTPSNPQSKCCFKDCNNLVAGNTEERFCSKHWDEYTQLIINEQHPFNNSYKEPTFFKDIISIFKNIFKS